MAGNFEKFVVEHPKEGKFIEEQAKAVADEIIAFAKEQSGLPCPTPEATAWGKFTKQEQEHEGTLALSREIARRAWELGGEELHNALKLVRPAHEIGKRAEPPPGFNPLRINE